LIYCNVSECSNWKGLDTPVQRARPIGYVPLVPSGEEFGGSCARSGVSIVSSISISFSGVKQKVHKCASYNSTDEESSGIVCTESGCLYNTSSDGCDKKDIYIENKKVSSRHNGNSLVPMCVTFSDRRYSGHFDWRRIAEGGYGPLSNAPDVSTVPDNATSGPRKF